MSFDHEQRIKAMEVKCNVMQKEVSEVLGELHNGLLTLMNGTRLSTNALAERLDQVEAAIEKLFLAKQAIDGVQPEGTVSVRASTEAGVEL